MHRRRNFSYEIFVSCHLNHFNHARKDSKMPRHSTGSVYNETYAYYLDRLKERPFEGREAVLGIQTEDDRVVIPYFGDFITFTPTGLADGKGRQPDFSDCVVLCRYLLMAPAVEPTQTDWTAFRDFPDAGPLTVFWSDTVLGLLTTSFERRIDALKNACEKLGGRVPELEMTADICRVFTLLPKIPMLLIFNDADEEFPAAASLLFEKRASAFLDAESQVILGHRLAERLTAAG